MTFNQALNRAIERAIQSQDERFVIYEDHEFHVTDAEGLDTFWAGATVKAAADVDGSFHIN